MVLKKSKYGINTGNTLRAGYFKQYYYDLCANAKISQQLWFQGDDIERQNVAATIAGNNLPFAFYPFNYTLSANKQERWKMVQDIQDLVECLKPMTLENASQWLPDIELTVHELTELGEKKTWNFFVENAVKSNKDPFIWNQHSRGVQRKHFLPHCEKEYKSTKTCKQSKVSKRSIRNDFENAAQERQVSPDRSALKLEYSLEVPPEACYYRVYKQDQLLVEDFESKYAASKCKGQKSKNRAYWKGLNINEGRHPEDHAFEFIFRNDKKKRQKIPKKAQESDPEKLGFTGPYSKTKSKNNKEKVTGNDTTLKSAKENQNYTKRSKEKKKREKADTFSKSQESKAKEKVSLWSFIEVLLQQKTENKKLQIVDCKGNSCSLSNENRKDTNLELSKQPSPPQGKKPEKLRQRKVRIIQGNAKDKNKREEISSNKETKQGNHVNLIHEKVNVPRIEQMEEVKVTQDDTEKTTIEKAFDVENQENSTKSKSKKKRKIKQKVEDEQNLSELAQDNRIVSSGILNIPLQIKVKSSTLDADFLSKKFGKVYKECKGMPRCFCVDITQDVASTYQVVERDTAFLAIVLFQCSDLHYESHQTVAIDNQTVEQIRLKLLIDLESVCQEALVLSLMKTLHTYLIYPVQKLLEIVINAFKNLSTITGLQQLCVEEPPCLPVSPEKRTNYDWLNALCSWQYDIYSAPEARNIFSKEEPSSKKVAECGTSTDPVTCLNEMSLKEYKCHLLTLQDTKIQQHPQWQKCPNTICKRVVKLCAPGLLDYFVIIECMCGKAWCFSCQSEAHWPASCSQARKYRDLQEKKDSLPDCYIKKEVCTLCMNRSKLTTQTNVFDPACQCLFTLCVSCLSISDSLSEIKPALEQVLSIGDGRFSLLPYLFQKNAMYHRVQRLAWNQTEKNIAAVAFTRQIQKSKIRPATMLPSIGQSGYLRRAASKLSCLGPIQAGGTLRESMNILQPLPPSIGSPRIQAKRSNDMGALFIAVVQNFVNHSHYLLEYVSVVLSQTVISPEVSTIGKLVCNLESIVEDIDKILQQTQQNPTVLLHLKRQIEEGDKVTADIVSRVRHLYSTKKDL